jgi:DNA-binding CsgD family transcriptional regulator/tetratricopeptide (TPR) repeat protein
VRGRGAEVFVGRVAELATFEHALSDARNHVPRVLLVGGDPGIGKSTLVRVAVNRAKVPAYLGRCVHIGGDAVPLAPLSDLLRQIRRSSPELLGASAQQPLARLAGGEATAGDSGGTGTLFVSLLDLVGRLTTDDVAVVGFEDLHWADPATWDLFELLARNLSDEAVVVVGTFRTAEVQANPQQRHRLGELTRLPAAHRLHLAGLTRADVASQVIALVGDPPPPGLVEDVAARGEGNPFFTEQLVAARLAGEQLPPVVSELIAADIAELEGPARQVLAVVAVAGRATPHGLLAAVAALPEDSLDLAIRDAVDARLLVVDRDDAYRFRHALIGEVTYAALLPSERRHLHHAVAGVLRREPGLALTADDVGGELAAHLERAGDRQGAFTASLEAADAAARDVPAAALAQLERAMRLWDEVGGGEPRRAERLWQAAELASATGRNERAVELARAAAAAAPHPDGVAFGHERLGRYLWAAGEIEASTAEYEQAATLLSSAGTAAGAATFAGLAQAELMHCRYPSAERWARRALDAAPEPRADANAWAMATRVVGVLAGRAGRSDEAVLRCGEAWRVAPTAHTRALAAAYLVIALLDAGRREEAAAAAMDALAHGHTAGLDHSFGAYLAGAAAEALIRLGRWSEADAVLDRFTGVEVLPIGVVQLSRAGAVLAGRRGDRRRARMLLARAAAQPVDPWHLAHVHATGAEVHLLVGDWDAAAERAEAGWRSRCASDRLWPPCYAMLAVTARVEATLDARARQEPVDLDQVVTTLVTRVDDAEAGCRRDATEPTPVMAAHLAEAVAQLTRLTGADPDAWATAAQRWAALGDTYATAVARLREAEAAVAVGDADRAAASLRGAQQTVVDLGATAVLEEVEAVSRRTRIRVDLPMPRALDDGAAARLGLTPREAEVLGLLAAGQTNRQIGNALFVSEKTASVHVSNILRKLGVTSRVEAAAVAQRLGFA